MTNKKAIKNNIFGLYTNDKNYSAATIEIKEAADKLIEIMDKYKDVGATDTESRDSISYYLAQELCK